MRRPEAGFGLVLLIALTAFVSIALAGASVHFTNAARDAVLKVNKAKAYEMARAGVMRALYEWRRSAAAEMSRVYASVTDGPPGTNLTYKYGNQSNFAHFTHDATELSGWTSVNLGPPTGTVRRLQQWRVRNIHTNNGSTITANRIRVTWSPQGTGRLRRVVLNGVEVLAPSALRSGEDAAITPTALSSDPASAANVWGGVNTYLEWSGNINNSLRVTVQWTFADDDATHDSRTGEITYWDGTRVAPGVASAARPVQHVFFVTSTGLVNQGSGPSARETVRATVSSTPGGATRTEIMRWERVERGT